MLNNSNKMQSLIILVITMFWFYKGLHAQQQVNEAVVQEGFCEAYTTCDSCAQAETYCAWCYQENFSSDRCAPKPVLINNGCREKFMFANGENSVILKTDSDKDFHDVTNPDNVEESVQIKPQKMTLKLHPKQPLQFNFTYRLANNYPLDLYYLMDLTYTMEHDVKTMATLGVELTEVLKDLTKHYRVAFGYYSDKVAMPFSKMTREFLENPCANEDRTCIPGFDFVHTLNFTSNVDEFIDKISASKTTSNLDNLEGGMDALYQIILCQEYLQWRKNSRRVVVIATDGILHFAGDGILAGAINRNADQCFLDENGVYAESLTYDYPSLEEVHNRLLQHKMNVLFAAKEDALEYYRHLNDVIPDVSFVGKLEEKSTNVLNLVKEGYFSVVKKVEFSANHSDNLRVTFETTCNKMIERNASSMCDNVEVGKEYLFHVNVEVLQVPTDRDRDVLVIQEKNIAEELVVEIEYAGKCKCINMENNGRTCSGHGVYKCGVCECVEEWKGENCNRQCTEELFEECRERNESYTSSTCHGHGDCDCGKCLCDEEYTGKYCQEKQCPKDKKGRVCGGYLHGICKDGVCQCRGSYTGKDCSCPTSKKNCIPPGETQECSGNGECKCGKCICSSNSYTGDYCELCPTCSETSGLCSTYEDCVLDTLKNISNSEKCFKEDGTTFNPQIINHTLVAGTTTCILQHDGDDGYVCRAHYNYNIRKDLIVDLKIFDECYKPMQASVFIAIIVGSILGVGLLLILAWKAKLMNDDRKEYARFQQEVDRRQMLSENPLYNSPIRTYQMPMELQHSRS